MPCKTNAQSRDRSDQIYTSVLKAVKSGKPIPLAKVAKAAKSADNHLESHRWAINLRLAGDRAPYRIHRVVDGGTIHWQSVPIAARQSPHTLLS